MKRKKQNLNKEKLLPAIFFLVKLNLLSIPLYLAIYLNFSYLPLQIFVASLTAGSFRILGYEFSQNENFLTTFTDNKFLQVEVSWDSVGWKSVYALAALIIATPRIVFHKKLRFLIFALPAIFLVNLLRIFSTIYLSLVYGLEYFDFLHTTLWRISIIGVVLAFWLVFLQREKHNILKNKSLLRISWPLTGKFQGLKTKSK